ncbi:Yip1 domain [Candidatus Methanoperedens nitroreducens]|uniref:Yip1 domain n=1 Tax=Candidatus Methanoperedens nitratireducens TaxID=1392998 RepID=A0A062V261_9EURY|nr:YIP1 family protein [Candidatus Methanoperedens nitroreducens]KCZ71422.1 Yip1 domain [Candidatus Methanoperedens nitroreducens]MDJ1421048.1 YIP1 family protein [Candidatus Methanoperedens sp.]
MNFLEKVKGFLLEPSNAFYLSKEDTFFQAMKYYFILGAIYSALHTFIYSDLLTLMSSFSGTWFDSMVGSLGMVSVADPGIERKIMIFADELLYALPGIFIGGAIFHIGVYIAGGKKGFDQTLRITMYGSTPSLLLGWIPIIGIIAGIWSLILQTLGIRQLHEITIGRAIIAVLIPLIILGLLTVVLFGAIFLFGIKIPV